MNEKEKKFFTLGIKFCFTFLLMSIFRLSFLTLAGKFYHCAVEVMRQKGLAFSRQHLLTPQNLSGGSKEQMAFAGLFNNMICMLEMRSPK